MTAPDIGDFDPGQHLSFSDISVDDPRNTRTLTVCIKRSKIDPFQRGVTINVGKTDSPLCPVAAMLAYLVLWGPGDGQLFRFTSGEAMTRQHLVVTLREVLARASFKTVEYAGHSFNSVATMVAVCRVPVVTIKTLGHWMSQAYLLYVRLPRRQLADISCTLVSSKFQQGLPRP